VWGGFSMNNSTLTRFFTLHFLLPFILFFFVFIHLIFIHENKSSNPIGLDSNFDKISFHPYFVIKDITRLVLILFIIFIINTHTPFIFIDPDNFIPANPIVTPTHIQPE
jgi:ubiquinol-cytochrome c reductase cytochrome b subunit